MWQLPALVVRVRFAVLRGRIGGIRLCPECFDFALRDLRFEIVLRSFLAVNDLAKLLRLLLYDLQRTI